MSVENPKPKVYIIISQWELKICLKKVNLSKTRENVGDQVMIGFSFVSDWLRGYLKFCRPTTDRIDVKPKQSCITFDTRFNEKQTNIIIFQTRGFLFSISVDS